jgi:hypothetical protein
VAILNDREGPVYVDDLNMAVYNQTARELLSDHGAAASPSEGLKSFSEHSWSLHDQVQRRAVRPT